MSVLFLVSHSVFCLVSEPGRVHASDQPSKPTTTVVLITRGCRESREVIRKLNPRWQSVLWLKNQKQN